MLPVPVTGGFRTASPAGYDPAMASASPSGYVVERRQPDLSAGLCARHPEPDLWSSKHPGDRVRAIAVCKRCPLRALCAEWALTLPVTDRAIYGAMWYAERLRARQGRQAAQEAARLAQVPAGMARRNAAKETCDSGHPLEGANLILLTDPRDGRTYRSCRECRRRRRREHQARRRLLYRDEINAARRAAYAAASKRSDAA